MALLSGVIKKILDSVLKDYVHGDFDVAISLFGQHAVDLEHLEVKANVVNDLLFGELVPLKFTYISVGKVTLDIPFSRLGSRPCQLQLSNCLVVVQPTQECDWDQTRVTAELDAAKKAIIAALWAKFRPDGEYVSLLNEHANYFGYVNNHGVLNRTLTRIIDNLQISLSNIHVRFEMPCLVKSLDLFSPQGPDKRLYFGGLPSAWEDASTTGSVFSLHVSSLKMVTTNEVWDLHFDDDCDSIVFKVITLEKLDIIWEPKGYPVAMLQTEGDLFSTYMSYLSEVKNSMRRGPWNLQSPRYITGPLRVQLRVRLNTVLSVGENEPHNLDIQIHLSPVVVRLGTEEISNLAFMAAHFSRHAMFVARVVAVRKAQLTRRIQELENEGGSINAYTRHGSMSAEDLYRRLLREREGLEDKIEFNEKYGELIQVLEYYLSEESVNDSLRNVASYVIRNQTKPTMARQSSSVMFQGHEMEQGTVSASGYDIIPDTLKEAFLKEDGDDAGECGMDEFEITFGAGETGLRLDQGFVGETVVVISCVPGSPAAQMRLIDPGMVITAIGKKSVIDKTAEETLSLFAKARRPARIRFQGSEQAAKNARKYLRGTKVNFMRGVLALDSLDVTLHSGTLPLCSLRAVALASSLNALSASPAVEFWGRYEHIVTVESAFGLAFLDIVDVQTEKEPSPFLTTVDVNEQTAETPATFVFRDLIRRMPFGTIDSVENHVENLMQDDAWISSAFLIAATVWCVKPLGVPRGTVETVSFLDLAEFESWKTAAIELRKSLFGASNMNSDGLDIYLNNESIIKELHNRMRQYSKIQYQAKTKPFLKLEMVSQYRDTFLNTDQSYCDSRVTGSMGGIYVALENDLVRSLVKLVEDVAESLPQGLELPEEPPNLSLSFVKNWSSISFSLNIDPIVVLVTSSIMESQHCFDVKELHLEIGPFHLLNQEDLSELLRTAERQNMDPLEPITSDLVCESIYLQIGTIRVSAILNDIEMIEKLKAISAGEEGEQDRFFDPFVSNLTSRNSNRGFDDTNSVGSSSLDSYSDAVEEEVTTVQPRPTLVSITRGPPVEVELFKESLQLCRYTYVAAPVCSDLVTISMLFGWYDGAKGVFGDARPGALCLRLDEDRCVLLANIGIILGNYSTAIGIQRNPSKPIKNPFESVPIAAQSEFATAKSKELMDAIEKMFPVPTNIVDNVLLSMVYETVIQILGPQYGRFMAVSGNLTPKSMMFRPLGSIAGFVSDTLFKIPSGSFQRMSVRTNPRPRSVTSARNTIQASIAKKELVKKSQLQIFQGSTRFHIVFQAIDIWLLDSVKLEINSLFVRCVPMTHFFYLMAGVNEFSAIDLMAKSHIARPAGGGGNLSASFHYSSYTVLSDVQFFEEDGDSMSEATVSELSESDEEIDTLTRKESSHPEDVKSMLEEQRDADLKKSDFILRLFRKAVRLGKDITTVESDPKSIIVTPKFENGVLRYPALLKRLVRLVPEDADGSIFWKSSKPILKECGEIEVNKPDSMPRLDCRMMLANIETIVSLDTLKLVRTINNHVEKVMGRLKNGNQESPAKASPRLPVLSRVSLSVTIETVVLTVDISSKISSGRSPSRFHNRSISTSSMLSQRTKHDSSTTKVEFVLSFSAGYVACPQSESAVLNLDRFSITLSYNKDKSNTSRFNSGTVSHSIVKPWRGTIKYVLFRNKVNELQRELNGKISPVRFSCWVQDAGAILYIIDKFNEWFPSNSPEDPEPLKVSDADISVQDDVFGNSVKLLRQNTNSIFATVLSTNVCVSDVAGFNCVWRLSEVLRDIDEELIWRLDPKFISLISSLMESIGDSSVFVTRLTRGKCNDVEIDSCRDHFKLVVQQLQVELVREIFSGLSPVESFIPVQKVSINNFRFFADSDMIATTEFDVEAQYYNIRLGTWEYSIEPWTDVRIGFASAGKPYYERRIYFRALERLNLNISDDVLNLTFNLYSTYLKALTAPKSSLGATGSLSAVDEYGELEEEDEAGVEPIKQSSAAHAKPVGRLHHRNADHWIINKTGVPVMVYDLFQIGVNVQGTLRILYKDAWSHPSMERWLQRPEIGMTVTPHNEHAGSLGPTTAFSDGNLNVSESDDESTASSLEEIYGDDDANSKKISISRQEGDLFTLNYPECKHDALPELIIQLKGPDGAYYVGTIDLTPHILFPNVRTVEWVPLRLESEVSGIGAEILLDICFDPADGSDVNAGEEHVPWLLDIDAVSTLDFSNTPKKHWFQSLNRKQISDNLKHLQTNMLQSVGLDFGPGIALHVPFRMVVPMDDTGSCILTHPLEGNALAAGKNSSLNVSLVSGMLDRKRRMILLESPLQIRNETHVPISFCVLGKSLSIDRDSDYPTLDFVPMDMSETSVSGSYLDPVGLGIRNIFDRSGESKWVDGGHLNYVNERPNSWIEWIFSKPVAICLYRIFPSTRKVEMKDHADLSSRSLKVDSRFLGVDPEGWCFQGKDTTADDWTTLHRATPPTRFATGRNREPCEYWLDQVDKFTMYRLFFDATATHIKSSSESKFDLRASDSDENDIDQGVAACGPGGTYPIAISGVDFFRERPGIAGTTSPSANESFLLKAGSLRFGAENDPLQTDATVHDLELTSLWRCKLCNETNSYTFEECSFCTSLRINDDTTFQPVESRLSSFPRTETIARYGIALNDFRKNRAAEIKDRAMLHKFAGREISALDKSILASCDVRVSKSLTKWNDARISLHGDSRVVIELLDASLAKAQARGKLHKKRLIVLTENSEISVNKYDKEVILSNVYVATFTAGEWDDLENSAMATPPRVLSLTFSQSSYLRVWEEKLREILQEKLDASRTSKEQTMFVKVLRPSEKMNIPLNFICSRESWKIVMRPVISDLRPPVKWVELVKDIDDPTLLDRRKYTLLCAPKAKPTSNDVEVISQSFTFSAHLTTKNQYAYMADSRDGIGAHGLADGQFLEKQEIVLEGWATLRNALPYTILVQISTHPSGNEAMELAPNEQVSLCEINHVEASLRIRLPQLGSGWTVENKLEEFTVSPGSQTLETNTRIPLYRAGSQHQPKNLVGHVELERARRKGRLEITIFASFWITNYSDVPVLIQSRVRGTQELLPDALLESNFDPKLNLPVLPTLACGAYRNFRMSVATSKRSLDFHRKSSKKSDRHIEDHPLLNFNVDDTSTAAVQRSKHCWKQTYRELETSKSEIMNSGWTKTVKVRVGGTTLSKSFGFKIGPLTFVRKNISVEIVPKTHAMPVVMMLNFRVQYFLVNNLPNITLCVKQLPYGYQVENSSVGKKIKQTKKKKPKNVEHEEEAVQTIVDSDEDETTLPMFAGDTMKRYREVDLVPEASTAFHFSGAEHHYLKSNYWKAPMGLTVRAINPISREPQTNRSSAIFFREGSYSLALRGLNFSLRETHGAKHIRVVVRRESGTYFVVFGDNCPENQPFYQIHNKSRVPVEILQLHSLNVIVHPGEALLFAWDDPFRSSVVEARTLSVHSKGAIIESGSDGSESFTSMTGAQKYNMDELKSMNPLEWGYGFLDVRVQIAGSSRVLEFVASDTSASNTLDTLDDEEEEEVEVEETHVIQCKFCLKDNPEVFNQQKNSYRLDVSCADVFREINGFNKFEQVKVQNPLDDIIDVTIRLRERPIRLQVKIYQLNEGSEDTLIGTLVRKLPGTLWTLFDDRWIDVDGASWVKLEKEMEQRDVLVKARIEELLLERKQLKMEAPPSRAESSYGLFERETSGVAFDLDDSDEESSMTLLGDRVGDMRSREGLCQFVKGVQTVKNRLQVVSTPNILNMKKTDSKKTEGFAEGWVQIKCSSLQKHVAEYMTIVSGFLTSVGCSIMLGERKIEIAYGILQRLQLNGMQCSKTTWIVSNVGHLQLDNHDIKRHYPIVLSRDIQVKTDLQLFELESVLRRSPEVHFVSVDMFEAKVAPLRMSLDQNLLDNILELLNQLDSVGDNHAGTQETTPPYDIAPLQHVSSLSDMIYVGSMSMSDIQLLLEVNIPHADNILETAIKISALKLEVQAYERSYVFEQKNEFVRKWYDYLFYKIIRVNLPKVLTRTQVAVNPLPPIYKVIVGTVDLVYQPLLGCYTECCRPLTAEHSPNICFCLCYGGLQKGMISFIGNATHGITLATNAVVSLTASGLGRSHIAAFDIVMSPISTLLSRLGDVSHALSFSAEVVLVETLGGKIEIQKQVRLGRSFTPRGEISLYGAGNQPRVQQKELETASAIMIAKWWRTLKGNNRRSKLNNLNVDAILSTSEANKRSYSWLSGVKKNFNTFWNDFKN